MRYGFTALPNAVLKARNISRDAKILYAFLLHYAWQDQQCFPGYDTLCTDLDASENMVRKYMRELEAARLIRQQRRGLGKTNIYIITEVRTSKSEVPEQRKGEGTERRQSAGAKPRKTEDYKDAPTKTHYKKGVPTNQKSYDDDAYTRGRYGGLVLRGAAAGDEDAG